MRIGLMQEGHRPEGVSIHQRWQEMAAEALLADEVGFDFYGQGEQHFARFTANVPTPEVTHAYLAGRTERIRFRAMSVNLLPFNHPIRVAEQVAALDVLSGGRAELGVARSNNPFTLEAFGIAPTSTHDYRDEQLDIIGKAFAQDTFEYHGKLYDIPERPLRPRPVQDPHPPIYLSATGLDSHREAGLKGLGVMTGNTSAGWEYAQACIDTYREAQQDAQPVGAEVLDSLCMFSTAVNCAPTREEAKEGAAPVARKWMDIVLGLYTNLSKTSPDYAYLANIENIREHAYDLDYLIDSGPYISLGTPEFFIERAKQLMDMGVNEWILRIDGMGHETNKRAIELIGREVIPEVHRLSAEREAAQATG